MCKLGIVLGVDGKAHRKMKYQRQRQRQPSAHQQSCKLSLSITDVAMKAVAEPFFGREEVRVS